MSLTVQSKEGTAAGVGLKQGASRTWVVLRLEGGWEEVALKGVLQVVLPMVSLPERQATLGSL